jgi:hypothetical protein
VFRKSKCVRVCAHTFMRSHARPMQYQMRCYVFCAQVQVSAYDRAFPLSDM